MSKSVDPRDPRPDALLIKYASIGDRHAFDAIYHRHKEYVARIAMRFTSGDHDASMDVVQEVFIYLYRKIPSLELTARLTTYLYPIIKNIALTQKRRPKLRLVGGEESLASVAAPGSETRIDRPRIEELVESLPDTHREVLLMRFVDDMSLADIGVALGIPEGTVKSRLHNAIRVLREDERTRRFFELDEGLETRRDGS